MENQKAWPNEKSRRGTTMKGKNHKAQGRAGTAPLLAQSRLSLSTFARPRNDRVAMHEALRVYRTAHSTVFGSLDFQTCRIADSLKSAGREAALEVGLETWAATVSRRDLTHSLSLSLVASCHRRISLVKRETTDAYCASE